MLSRIDVVKEEFTGGRVVILVDDDAADNGGVFCIPAEYASKEAINFMMKNGSGFITVSLTEEKAEAIHLPRMNQSGSSPDSYDFSVDYIEAGTGVTAQDRAETIMKLLEEQIDYRNFKTPGHVFINKASYGGVLKMAGVTEAASDLSAISGCSPYGVYCDVFNAVGSKARKDELMDLAGREDLKIVSMEELIAYRRERDCYVVKEAEANLPTEYGQFRMVGFVNKLNGEHHVALVKGDIQPDDEVLVRVHSECLTGDAFHSLKCDCGEQLAAALMNIENEGKGILLYLRQEGRGIGLINKIKAYKLQEEGLDTEEANLALGFPSDMRDYGIGAQILSELNVRKMKLMTNNPKKLVGLRGHGIEITERVPIIMDTNIYNKRYFDTKKDKMGHLL
jgi:3,4-dihydroxy 2-butanone 4-phosphate synthase/GTP cyclohydrolase II